LIRRAALSAVSAGCEPVVVVARPQDRALIERVADLPVIIKVNPEWETGQSSSIRAGLSALPVSCGSAVFLLADQPLIDSTIITALEEIHRAKLSNIVVPMVDGQRGNPVLFDQRLFPELNQLQGDSGGRALFSKYPIEWLVWNDTAILKDIDTPSDLQKLISERNPNGQTKE
jgi:molybdenum cofactor cytidylyltransferase